MSTIYLNKGAGCVFQSTPADNHVAVLVFVLQVVTLLHTLLLCEKLEFATALIVCPLNTVLNWLNEFEKWQHGLKDEESLEVEIWYCILRRPSHYSSFPA